MTTLRAVDGGPAPPKADEFDAAEKIAEFLEEQAGRMPFDSPLRGLALRSAARWGAIGASRPLKLTGLPVLPQGGDDDDR